MKIVFYINNLGIGGAEKVMVNLAHYFQTSHENEIIMVNTEKIEKEYEIDKNIKRIILESNKNVVKGNFLIRNINRTLKLRKILKDEKPDVIVSFMGEANFRAILSRLFLKTKVLTSVRNDPNKEYKGFLSRILARILYLFSDGIVFQTNYAQKWFGKKIVKKSKIIMNPLSPDFFEETKVNERRDIVTVGRLEPQKNHVRLINVFREIHNIFPDEKLIIYGEGNEREKLQDLINQYELQNFIFLKGQTDNVKQKIKGAKIFVLSSDYEGLPNALMEAVALGVPSISIDCESEGPRMLIENEKNGYLVKDEMEMIEKISFLLSNKDKINEFSNYATYKSKQFQPNIIYQQWEKYIKYILKKGEDQ